MVGEWCHQMCGLHSPLFIPYLTLIPLICLCNLFSTINETTRNLVMEKTDSND